MITTQPLTRKGTTGVPAIGPQARGIWQGQYSLGEKVKAEKILFGTPREELDWTVADSRDSSVTLVRQGHDKDTFVEQQYITIQSSPLTALGVLAPFSLREVRPGHSLFEKYQALLGVAA